MGPMGLWEAPSIYGLLSDEVTNPPDVYLEAKQWDNARNDLKEALDGRLMLDRLIQKKRDAGMLAAYERPVKEKVVINNEESDFFTLILRSAANKMMAGSVQLLVKKCNQILKI